MRPALANHLIAADLAGDKCNCGTRGRGVQLPGQRVPGQSAAEATFYPRAAALAWLLA